MDLHPHGDYWRSISSLNFYGVVLAYTYQFTGSHIASLKLLLALLTVLYLLAFELFASLFIAGKRDALLLSLLSAVFVSFGASFWGVTDFLASLNRTVVIPPMLVVLWAFLRFQESPWRYLAFPGLIVLSLAHLSTYYLLLALLLYEAWDFAVERRLKPDRRLIYFGMGVGLALIMRWVLDHIHLGASQHIGYVISQVNHCTSMPSEACLSAAEAWEIEKVAFPWRNMPLPLATLATILLSFGTLAVLALAGAYRSWRDGFRSFDRAMLGFAVAVLLSAYGLQTLLLILRQFLPVYPVNFEEVRTINFLMIPALYFSYRLFRYCVERPPLRWLAIAIPILVVFQPAFVLRAMPSAAKTELFEFAMQTGLMDRHDTLRALYARQLLGLEAEEDRFYYAARGVIDWLHTNCRKSDRVMTNRNELLLLRCPVVGPFNTVQGRGVNSTERRLWLKEMQDVAAALATGDMDEVRQVAKRFGANLVVVPWPVDGAVYRDGRFSIVRVAD